MKNEIHVLDNETIDRIAAGEVVERPQSVVKELVENAIDAGADSITVEIEDGGIELIRVTDNGCGIEKSELQKAFFRHATSKIQKADDLFHIVSLGFRGEALSSISAVSKTEVITKTENELTGVRYRIEGGIEKDMEEIGAPDGTTFIVRNLFYNTPARRKFLKSAITEGNYISELMEKYCLSHPQISFRFILNHKSKFATSGNGNLREVIYRIYGKEMESQLIQIDHSDDVIQMKGYIGKPAVNRATRSFEIFFVNGRYIKSDILNRAVETAYAGFLMQHKYPFFILHIDIDTEKIDVNVHPNKMDIRFSDQMTVYEKVLNVVLTRLQDTELIPKATLLNSKEINDEKNNYISEISKNERKLAEPFENKPKMQENMQNDMKIQNISFDIDFEEDVKEENAIFTAEPEPDPIQRTVSVPVDFVEKSEQLSILDEKIIDVDFESQYKILGQVFKTYWIIAYKDKVLFIDQHAAHEKVKYEEIVSKIRNSQLASQQLIVPIVVRLKSQEYRTYLKYQSLFEQFGFQLEPFGGEDYAIRSVPSDLFGYSEKEMFLDIIDELTEKPIDGIPEIILEKMASMACKAAVKGNTELKEEEAKELIHQLLKLENPYNCPHGRPVIISMTQTEMEKKFKRIVS